MSIIQTAFPRKTSLTFLWLDSSTLIVTIIAHRKGGVKNPSGFGFERRLISIFLITACHTFWGKKHIQQNMYSFRHHDTQTSRLIIDFTLLRLFLKYLYTLINSNNFPKRVWSSLFLLNSHKILVLIHHLRKVGITAGNEFWLRNYSDLNTFY